MKSIIISQPKAGTYLCANLLQEFGLTFTGMHVRGNNYTQLDLDDLTYSRHHLKSLKKHVPLEDSLNLISDNQFAVSHLECFNREQTALVSFKKILLLRDYESAKKSWNTWSRITGKSKDSKNIDKKFRKRIELWKTVDNVFVMNFNDMKNKNIDVIDNLQKFLFEETVFDSDVCISNALRKQSLTKVEK